MKKIFLGIMIISLISCKGINKTHHSNSKWTGGVDEFISVKILDIGMNRSLQLTEDGMICRTVDSIGHSNIIFFNILDLNQINLIKVQDFLTRNKMLMNLEGEINTVPYNRNNCAQFVLSKYFYQEVIRIKDFSLCVKKLATLVDLINDLIPEVYLSRHKLIAYDLEIIKGCDFQIDSAQAKQKNK